RQRSDRRSFSKTQRAAALARIRAADKNTGFRVNHDGVRAAETFRIAADDLVAAPSEVVLDRLSESRLQADLRPFDMIEARRRDRLLRRHMEIDQIGNHLDLHLGLHVAALQTESG